MKSGSELLLSPLKGQIQDLIELFFQDLRAFGVFASHIRPTQASFEGYIGQHVANFNSLIKAAEEHRDLIPDNKSRPILYNYSSWPENAPIAGYYTTESGVKYSQLLTTYVANWQYEISEGRPLLSRLLRAALWMWNNSKLEDTLNYIFDLQKYGYFVIPEGIEDTITLLIRSLALGKNGQEVIPAYFKGKIPTSSVQWLTWEMEEPSKLLSNLHSVDAQPILESLIFDTIEELERVRDLNTPEEWLLSQAAALLRCRRLQVLCTRFVEEDHQAVGLKSILAQFEEIIADGGIYRWYQHRPMFAPLSSPMTMQLQAALFISIFRRKLGEAGETRFYQDRLFYPGILREQITRSDGKEVPQEWSIIPPRLLWPFAMSINQGRLDHAGRTKLFAPEQIGEISEVRGFFEKNGITSQKDRMQLLNEVYLQKIPDSWKTGGTPGIKLSDEQNAQFMDVLHVSHRSLCLKELLEEELHKIWYTSDLGEEEQESILRKVFMLYPWSPAVYVELAIYHDESGDHLLAWDYILTAILLSLDNSAVWHAASVILGRLGNDADADFAWAIYTVTKEEASK